jgi:hypothetical protein
VSGRDVALLAGIALHVVERAGADLPRAHEAQRAARQHGLRVALGEGEARQLGPGRRRGRLGGREAGEERAEIGAAHARRTRDGEARQHRGQEIDELHRRRDALRRDEAGRAHHERHAHLLLVDGGAVVAPAVLAELLAVIGGDDHHRVGARRAHRRHHRAEPGVGRGDLGVVTIDVAIAEGVLGVGLVRLVGLEEVHPEEEAAIFGLPGEVGLHRLGALGGGGELDAAVLEVEGALAHGGEALAVDEEDRGRVEGGSAVAVMAQVRGPGLGVVAQAHEDERPHVLAGHDRGDGVGGVRRR